MDKEDIKLDDIQRIFIGDAPPIFLLEVFLRTLLTYVALLVLLRILGKRMNGNATVTEMAVILTLGAIVSVPMQSPTMGLMIGMLGLICAFIFHRGLNWLNVKNRFTERWVQGNVHILVRDGVINVKALEKTNISIQQIFAVLRSKDVYNLGEVKRLYIEACGVFTVYKFAQSKPGLSTLPAEDSSFEEIYKHESDMKACTYCGYVAHHDTIAKCNHCGHEQWTHAIKNKTLKQ